MITAGSSSARSVTSSTVSASPSSPSNSPGVTMSASAPASSAPCWAASANPCQAATSFAPERTEEQDGEVGDVGQLHPEAVARLDPLRAQQSGGAPDTDVERTVGQHEI